MGRPKGSKNKPKVISAEDAENLIDIRRMASAGEPLIDHKPFFPQPKPESKKKRKTWRSK